MHRSARTDAQMKALLGLAAIGGTCALAGLALHQHHKRELAKLRSKDRARLAQFTAGSRADFGESREAMLDEIELRLVP